MATTKVTLCAECRTDGGWHYSEDGTASRCPNILSAIEHQAALELTKQQNTKAFEAACRIIRDFAETHQEFSGNTTRDAMRAAQIPSNTVGRAYTAMAEEGVIEDTGRMVRNTDENTRHKIHVWLSLKHPAYIAAHTSALGRQAS